MFKGMYSRILQDLISKGLQMAGAAITGTGIATGEQTTAIVGGIGALIGVLWNAYNNNRTNSDVAVVATANDTKQTTKAVLQSEKIVKQVGSDK